MTVITISREFGSGGDALAERVAATLGYHLVDKAFISAVLCQYGITEFDVEYEKTPGFWEGFDRDKADRRELMVRMLNQVVRTVACHGNVVILGRSGFAILPGLADVLHVRLQAPLDERVARVSQERKLSFVEAEQLVKDKDGIRTAFVESFYGASWQSSLPFDVVINTAVVPLDVATAWVVEAAKLRAGRHGDKPTCRQIEVDPVMMLSVTERLKCSAEHLDPA
jgi:cytidylate kinase